VVVFAADLKKMGDVRQLEGRQVDIKGTIQDYDGRAEIILLAATWPGRLLCFPRYLRIMTSSVRAMGVPGNSNAPRLPSGSTSNREIQFRLRIQKSPRAAQNTAPARTSRSLRYWQVTVIDCPQAVPEILQLVTACPERVALSVILN